MLPEHTTSLEEKTMRRRPIMRAAATTLAAVAVLALVTAVAAAPPQQPRNFVAPLSASEETSPSDSTARGVGIFQLSADGTQLSYRLIASNIENVHMAHIHLGPAGDDGPVVVWLYPSTTPGPGPADSGRHDGVLATGTITAADLVGPLAGADLADLVDAIATGNAYVNVHTLSTVLPAGLGNLPGGEIRGQLP